ncbi:hypothetical protein JCM6882_005299 [Rhodosporidiobolus microsporus]
MGKLLGRVWVTGTLILISFLGFSSQICIVAPSFPGGFTDPGCLRLLVPFNVLLALLYYSYFLTVTTDPGQVPKGWEPDWKQMETGEMEVKKLTGGARYCRTCRAYKPPRAHHCRQCKRCVLKMDHHCPWVNNCVGHFNYGHFCRFLFFVDVTCSFHIWMVTKRAFGSWAFFVEPSTSQMVILVLNYVACAPVIIAVGVFSLYHLYSVVTNTTTIEGWEKDKVASLKRRGKIREYRYPYHLGYLANVKAVLGNSVLFWCWPQRALGDGLSYPTALGTDKKDQLSWPPRDEHVPLRRRPAPPSPESAFTYGTGLNPSLHPAPPRTAGDGDESSALRQRRRRPKAAARAPWMSGGEDSSAGEEAEEHDEDEDDVPLGTLAERQQRVCIGGTPGAVEEDEEEPEEEGDEDLDPDRSVRIRRGSEGYEIRPRMSFAPAPPQPPRTSLGSPSTVSDGSWELAGGASARFEGDEEEDGEEEELSEWEVDEEGDRRRAGARYKYYVREEDSESDLEEVVSVSGGEAEGGE